MPAISLGGSGA